MPKDGYVSVTVREEQRDRANNYLPDDNTLGEALVAGANALSESVDDDNDEMPGDTQDAIDSGDMDELKRMVREATEAAQSAERSVEELTEGRR